MPGIHFLEYRIRISANYTGGSKSVLTHLFRPMGKIKNETFHVFDIHWLYRMLRYAIVNVDVNGRNDLTKRHGIVITTWRTPAIEVTALSKTHFQK